MTRILIADDHPMIQSAVESMLRGTSYELVGTATTGAEALDSVREHDPDILVLDVQMPEGSGIDVLRTLRSKGDGGPVVLLTASIDDAGFGEALALKVEGVLLKTSDPGLLIECLERVEQGDHWIDPHLRDRAFNLRDWRAPAPLSPRERQLVTLVRQGLRNREISERLGVTEGTVKVYLHSVFEKTGVANRTELAIRAAEWIGPPPAAENG